MLILFHIKRQSEDGVPLGWGIELCECSKLCVRFQKFVEY